MPSVQGARSRISRRWSNMCSTYTRVVVLLIMGAGISIAASSNEIILPVLASINMVALVSLIGHAADSYLVAARGKPDYNGAVIRLQILRLVSWAVSVVAALKITLPSDLADGIISAWFVGQGFALQSTIQSIFDGIAARYSDIICKAVVNKDPNYTIKYNDRFTQAHVIDSNITTFTLQQADVGQIVLPWTSVHQIIIKSK